MLILLLLSVLSIAGFILNTDMLFIGPGVVNLIIFLIYFNHQCNAEIQETSTHPGEIMNKQRWANFLKKVGITLLMLFIFGWLFSWKLFIWAGVIFGLYWIPEIAGNITGKRSETGLKHKFLQTG